MQAITEIKVTFEETNNFEFIEKIYIVVDSVFAFICNRKNTTCTTLKLTGQYPTKTIRNQVVVDTMRTCHSDMFFFNKYREDPESDKIVAKTFYAVPLLKHIDALFQLVADDISSDKKESANISISSLHPSLIRRKMIDLQQSLHITSAFEFYVRRYLPNMSKESDHHAIIKMLLHEFAEKNHGKAKKLALSLEQRVVSEPSLEDKIVKSYNGYDVWKALKPCLSADWFGEREIRILAKEANKWRNELAHEKRSYTPNESTIRAIRLIEHMNYAIVLRQIGYDDYEIRGILENVLVR